MNKLSNRAIIGICKVGDIYCPENGEFPAYSKVVETTNFDMLVENAPKDDIEALGMVLAIFSFLPNFVLRWLINSFSNSMTSKSNGVIAANLRQLNMGLRGLVYSTYYTELTNKNYTQKTPLDVLDYSLNRVVD